MVGDIKLRNPLSEAFSQSWIVGSGTAASINNGEPTKAVDAAGGAWTGAVAIMVDADGTTAQRFTGVAKTVSTETTTAAGEVYTWLPLPGIIYSALAKTASLANTAALINGLKGKRVIFDLTAAKWTVDTAATDANVNGLVIVGGEYQTSTIFFEIKRGITFLDNVAA